jgi:hypothetical protein
MKMWKLLLLGLACFLGLTAAVAQEAKKVELQGKLRTDIVAIGGETTGVIIQTKEGDFELDLGKNKEIRDTADKLHGKMVQVSGTLTVRKGVEVKERKIVAVSKLEEVKK